MRGQRCPERAPVRSTQSSSVCTGYKWPQKSNERTCRCVLSEISWIRKLRVIWIFHFLKGRVFWVLLLPHIIIATSHSRTKAKKEDIPTTFMFPIPELTRSGTYLELVRRAPLKWGERHCQTVCYRAAKCGSWGTGQKSLDCGLLFSFRLRPFSPREETEKCR